MTQAVPSTVKPDRKFRVRAAEGGPVDLLSQVRDQGGQLSWVFAGKLGLIGANAVVMLFLAGRLELKTYGLLVLTISGQLLISRLLMLGTDAGMVRLTALDDLKSRSPEIVTAGLILIARSSAVLLLVWLLLTPVLSVVDIPAWVVACIVTGAVGTALVDYGYSFRLARQEYPLGAVAQGGTAIWRVALTVLSAINFPTSPAVVFIAYHGASLVSGLVQTLLILRTSRRPERALIQRLLRYSWWLGKANVVVIFSLYQGTLLLMLLKQPAATGLFGLGLTLSLAFFALYNAYSEYLTVRIRSVEHSSHIRGFLARSLAAAVALIVASAPVIFAVAMLVPWFLGPAWLDVVPVFVYLSASMVLLMLQAPLVAACHYFLKPHLIMFGWLMRAVFIGLAGIVLAPRWGAVGAAIGQLIGSALALLALSWLVAGSLRSSETTN